MRRGRLQSPDECTSSPSKRIRNATQALFPLSAHCINELTNTGRGPAHGIPRTISDPNLNQLGRKTAGSDSGSCFRVLGVVCQNTLKCQKEKKNSEDQRPSSSRVKQVNYLQSSRHTKKKAIKMSLLITKRHSCTKDASRKGAGTAAGPGMIRLMLCNMFPFLAKTARNCNSGTYPS